MLYKRIILKENGLDPNNCTYHGPYFQTKSTDSPKSLLFTESLQHHPVPSTSMPEKYFENLPLFSTLKKMKSKSGTYFVFYLYTHNMLDRTLRYTPPRIYCESPVKSRIDLQPKFAVQAHFLVNYMIYVVSCCVFFLVISRGWELQASTVRPTHRYLLAARDHFNIPGLSTRTGRHTATHRSIVDEESSERIRRTAHFQIMRDQIGLHTRPCNNVVYPEMTAIINCLLILYNVNPGHSKNPVCRVKTSKAIKSQLKV